MFSMTVVDTTVLPNNEITAQWNQIHWNQKIKEILWYWTVGPGVFALICHTLQTVLVVGYLVIH